VPAFFTRYAWAKWPFLRGVFALADSMVLGIKALLFSANLAMEDQAAGDAAPEATEAARAEVDAVTKGPLSQVLLGPILPLLAAGSGSGPGTIGSIQVTGTAILALALGIGLFMVLPAMIAHWLTPVLGETIWRAAAEGVLRACVMLGYIRLVSTRPEVERLFQYHGAEHKAINALETEGIVDVDASMRASRIHPRCGTNFVITVLLVKTVVIMLLPWQATPGALAVMRIALLPLVAAISFEIIRLAGKYRNFKPLQWLVAPGLLTQNLTTREPDREMVEVAVASLRAVRDSELAGSPAAAAA
jgi:uncharacterized protein YqhQ